MRPPGRPTFSRRSFSGLAAGLAAMAAGIPQVARAAHVVRPWPTAKAVPPLDLADLGGHRWGLRELRGEVVVLNFWATWCEPCRREMPSLLAMQESKRGRKLRVVTVNYLEPADKVRDYIAHLAAPPPVLLDGDGEATAAWTPRVFPSTVLIGRDGAPASTVLGDLDWQGSDAAALLAPLLDARTHA